MPGDNKRLYVLKQTCSYTLQVCLSMYDILFLPGITESLEILSILNYTVRNTKTNEKIHESLIDVYFFLLLQF